MTAAQFGTSLVFFAVDAQSAGDNPVVTYTDVSGRILSANDVKNQGMLILELRGSASEALTITFKSGDRSMAGPITLGDVGKGLDLSSTIGLFVKSRGDDLVVTLDGGSFGGSGCGVLQ